MMLFVTAVSIFHLLFGFRASRPHAGIRLVLFYVFTWFMSPRSNLFETKKEQKSCSLVIRYEKSVYRIRAEFQLLYFHITPTQPQWHTGRSGIQAMRRLSLARCSPRRSRCRAGVDANNRRNLHKLIDMPLIGHTHKKLIETIGNRGKKFDCVGVEPFVKQLKQ